MDSRPKRKCTTRNNNIQNKLKSTKSSPICSSPAKLQKKKNRSKGNGVKDDTSPVVSTPIEPKQKCPCPCGLEEPNCNWDKPPLLILEHSWNESSKKIEVPWIECDACNTWWHLHCSGLIDIQGNLVIEDKFLCLDCQVKNTCIPITVLTSRYIKHSTKDNLNKNLSSTKITSKVEIASKESKKDDTNIKDPIIPKTISSNTISERQNSKEYIVIVDQIDSAFRSSVDIRAEVKKVYPDIEPKYCYPLPKGGIALHLNTKEEEQTCLNEWPPGSFRTQRKVKPHKPKALHKTTVVAKNVNVEYSEEEIREDLVKRYKSEFTVRRITNSYTKTTYPVVKITVPKELGNQLLNQGVIICDRYYHC